MIPLQKQIREEFDKRYYIRAGEFVIEHKRAPDSAEEWRDIGYNSLLDVLQSQNEELVRKIEEMKLNCNCSLRGCLKGVKCECQNCNERRMTIKEVLTIIKSL